MFSVLPAIPSQKSTPSHESTVLVCSIIRAFFLPSPFLGFLLLIVMAYKVLFIHESPYTKFMISW